MTIMDGALRTSREIIVHYHQVRTRLRNLRAPPIQPKQEIEPVVETKPEPPQPEPPVVAAIREVKPDYEPTHGPQKPHISANIILKFVSEVEEVGIEIIKTNIRRSWIVHARHTAFFLIRNLAGLSYPQIGKVTGGRDHTTVMSAMTNVAERRARDQDYDADLIRYEKILRDRFQCRAPLQLNRQNHKLLHRMPR